MTRLILLISILIASIPSVAQAVITKSVVRKGTVKKSFPAATSSTYNFLQLKGKWQETTRRNYADNKRVSFSDTLQLDFNKRDSVIVRDKTSISQKGYAGVEGTKLQLAGDAYTIVSLSKNTMVINDGEFLRALQKKKMFYHETLGTVILPKEDLTDPKTVNVKNVLGTWDVYRTQATPGVAEDSAIIKNLTLAQQHADGSVTGEITFTKENVTQSLPFKAIFNKGAVHITTGGNTWSIYTYKADGKEFVFGHQGGLVYFAKQLK